MGKVGLGVEEQSGFERRGTLRLGCVACKWVLIDV